MITAGCSAARLRLRHDAALMSPTWRSGCISDMTGSVSDMTPAHIDADPSHSSRLSTGGQQSSAHQHVIASCLRSTASAQPTVIVVRVGFGVHVRLIQWRTRWEGCSVLRCVYSGTSVRPQHRQDATRRVSRVEANLLLPSLAGLSMFFSIGGGPTGGVWTSRLAAGRAAVREAANSLSLSRLSISHAASRHAA
jgi:hypothetical protein